MFEVLAGQWCPWCGSHMTGGGWLMMGFWWFGLIAILLVLWAVFRDREGNPFAPGHDRGEQVLRERYARGEIDEEEYRRKLTELRR